MKNIAGALRDLLTRRKYFDNIWGGPFNGQEIRRKIFKDIISRCKIEAIVETGTFKGNTTNFMYNQSKLPVFTVESDPRSFYYSSFRFMFIKHIKVYLNDCRMFLKDINNEISPVLKTFFYLDAHWNKDLPLKEELNIVFTSFDSAVVMVDDFKVPFDEGFKYDSYEDVELSLDYITDLTLTFPDIEFFFPRSSEVETGSKRGCILITTNKDIANQLSQIPYVRKYAPAA